LVSAERDDVSVTGEGEAFSRVHCSSFSSIIFGVVCGGRRQRQWRGHVEGIRWDGATACIATYFGVREQGFMTLPVDGCDRNVKVVPGIESQSLGRDKAA